jgi:hypothetical protein
MSLGYHAAATCDGVPGCRSAVPAGGNPQVQVSRIAVLSVELLRPALRLAQPDTVCNYLTTDSYDWFSAAAGMASPGDPGRRRAFRRPAADQGRSGW